jgi:hypothetical protein
MDAKEKADAQKLADELKNRLKYTDVEGDKALGFKVSKNGGHFYVDFVFGQKTVYIPSDVEDYENIVMQVSNALLGMHLGIIPEEIKAGRGRYTAIHIKN